MSPIERDINLIFELGSFRNITRAWAQFAGRDVENNAEHTFRVVWIALLLARYEGIEDTGKVAKMALVHDISEVRAGDAHYFSRMYMDRNEVWAIQDTLWGSSLEEEMLALWHEYEALQTPEAKVVKDADRLEADFEMKEAQSFGNAFANEHLNRKKEFYRDTHFYTQSGKTLFDKLFDAYSHDWHLKGRNRYTQGDWGTPNETK